MMGEIAPIVVAMKKEGYPEAFIDTAVEMALHDEDGAVFDLLRLWRDAPTKKEKAECAADIQELMDDVAAAPAQVEELPYLHFDQLQAVAENVAEFKAYLKSLITQHGGVSKVATLAGIPQPSLSRMLNSGSMPRRTTLYKLARAMGLSEKEIVTEWSSA